MNSQKDDWVCIKFAALFVLYNPTLEEEKHIKQMAAMFDRSYIFDNTPTLKAETENRQWGENAVYYSDGTNHGLANAYNYALNLSQKEHVLWLAIFDQDSVMDEVSVKKIMKECESTANNTAIICPFIQYEERENNFCVKTVEAVQWTINSGSFLNVELINYRRIRYDENYFLDRLDRDFCKQITNNGLRILRVNSAVMKQHLGECVNGKNVHSPLRNYYMARNRLYYNKKFIGLPYRWLLNVFQTVKHVLGIIRAGTEVKNNLKMMKHGICDYRHNKLGEFSG